GVRGFIFFMTVLRDRWYGAPLDAEGREQPNAAFVKRLLAILREVSWTRLRRRAEIALVLPSNYVRLATASSLADPVSPILIDFRSLLGPAGAAELARDDR